MREDTRGGRTGGRGLGLPSSRPAEAAADSRRGPEEDSHHIQPPPALTRSEETEIGIPRPTPGVMPLGALRRSDSGVAGGKAATLGELAGVGFPVPDGVVVFGEPDEAALSALAVLGDGPLAVRSSAVAEDLADASFAGQYDTVLGIRGPDALRAAIRQARDSARGTRAQHYRTARANGLEEGIAVLVQRMLAPEAAGVAFTANPITGECH